MKKIILGAVLLLGATSTLAGQLESIAEKYLVAYKNDDLMSATKILHCPESYSLHILENEYKSISSTLSIFVQEFGELESYKISNNNLYVSVTIGCGTTEYWNKHKPIKKLVYKTKHKNNQAGYIVFSFSKIHGKFVLAFSNHGVPMLGASSVNKIKNVIKRISNKKI